MRVDNPGQLFQAMTAGDLAVGEIGLGPSLIAVTRGLPLLSLFLEAFSTRITHTSGSWCCRIRRSKRSTI